jgi:hypothetical protein
LKGKEEPLILQVSYASHVQRVGLKNILITSQVCQQSTTTMLDANE